MKMTPNTSTEWLKLSVRCQTVFNQNGIKTLGQLCQMTEAELLGLQHFGRKSINDVIFELERHGLGLWGSRTQVPFNILRTRKVAYVRYVEPQG